LIRGKDRFHVRQQLG
jgi:hypothetical protein